MSEQKKTQQQTLTDQKPTQEAAIAHHKSSEAERFSAMVLDKLKEATGAVEVWNEYDMKLAQNLYVFLSNSLPKLEADRKNANRPPIIWKNVDLDMLAVDCKRIVVSGLDPRIKNHVHVKPYFLEKVGKYTLDLTPGFVGLDYVVRETSLYPIEDIVYELIHENDHFKVLKKNANRAIESYEFEITNPFDRGKVIGGFGYVAFKDETKNFVKIVTAKDFEKARDKAPTKMIWDAWPDNMKYKTLVRRTTALITKDPKKVNRYDALMKLEESQTVEGVIDQVSHEATQALSEPEIIDVDGFDDEPTSNQ